MQFEMPTPLQALLPALRLQPQKLAANVPEPSRAGPGRAGMFPSQLRRLLARAGRLHRRWPRGKAHGRSTADAGPGQTPLLAVTHICAESRPADDPLLRLVDALARSDPATARAVQVASQKLCVSVSRTVRGSAGCTCLSATAAASPGSLLS